MAKYSSSVEYRIHTTLDNSGIAKLQSEIRQTQQRLKELQSTGFISKDQLSDSLVQLQRVERAVQKAFNSNLGMLDTRKFSDLISKSNEYRVNMNQLGNAFGQVGARGQTAVTSLIAQVGKLDTGVKTTSKAVDKMANTIGNTLRWGVVASGFSQMMNAAHQAVQYVRDLDTSLTNIMMVTNYSREAMNEYAQSANDAAKALGSTTVAMTNASLVFAQQGTGNFWSNR